MFQPFHGGGALLCSIYKCSCSCVCVSCVHVCVWASMCVRVWLIDTAQSITLMLCLCVCMFVCRFFWVAQCEAIAIILLSLWQTSSQIHVGPQNEWQPSLGTTGGILLQGQSLRVFVDFCVCMCVCMPTCVCVCACACACACAYVCACMCACVCVFGSGLYSRVYHVSAVDSKSINDPIKRNATHN